MCQLCLGENKKKAIGQCTYVLKKKGEDPLFTGCDKYFCRKHGIVEVKLDDLGTDGVVLGHPVDEEMVDPNIRFCDNCNTKYLNAKYKFEGK